MIGRFFSAILALPIRFYRRFVSPLLPSSCRFHPSCSRYALDALEIHGAPRALWLILLRLGRCHPFHPGGVDPVPAPQVPGRRLGERSG